MRIFTVLILFVVGACTGTTTKHIAVQPAANTCQVTEVRPTSLSTLTLGICWDQAGAPIGMAGSGGTAVVAIPLAILGAGSVVSGAAILGRSVQGLEVGVDLGSQGGR